MGQPTIIGQPGILKKARFNDDNFGDGFDDDNFEDGFDDDNFEDGFDDDNGNSYDDADHHGVAWHPEQIVMIKPNII